jgi:hypothetical protein
MNSHLVTGKEHNMQFAKTQGRSLAALGLLLLLVQGFIFISSTRRTQNFRKDSPVRQEPTPAAYVPGILGLLSLGLGMYLIIAQRKRGNEEAQPEKTQSGFPM